MHVARPRIGSDGSAMGSYNPAIQKACFTDENVKVV